MKIRWEFQFEYERLRFGKPLRTLAYEAVQRHINKI